MLKKQNGTEGFLSNKPMGQSTESRRCSRGSGRTWVTQSIRFKREKLKNIPKSRSAKLVASYQRRLDIGASEGSLV